MALWIIGFGRVTTRDFGETGMEQECVWCSERVYYHLVRARTWFTYFFIPVIPYSTRYRVECPVCSRGLEIRDGEVKAAKRGELKLSRG